MIIEDEDLQYEIYEECLGQFELKRARSGTEAIKYASNFVPEVIVLDHVLENEELGLDFLPDFKQLMPHVPIVVVSGALEVQQQIEALQGPRRAHYCLPKPVDIHVLKNTIQTAVSECGEKEEIK
ncbi:MAG TPA: response regulator receiver protein, partial [Verrucomicrobiales bacterium]|nr:response regulator receiver protein [Verrucomicrobiales bacterium]